MNEDSERLDRLENHFKVYKTDVEDIKNSVREIRILLGGSALNNHKGFIRLMELNEDKVKQLEGELQDLRSNMDAIKFWGKGLAGAFFVIIGLILKKILSL